MRHHTVHRPFANVDLLPPAPAGVDADNVDDGDNTALGLIRGREAADAVNTATGTL